MSLSFYRMDCLNCIFIDGLSGMALGLFGTLIIGTILEQIGNFIPGIIGTYLVAVAGIAKSITGAGIGVGMAFKYKCSPLAGASAAVAGIVGAFAKNVVAGTFAGISGPGDPLCAFIAAFFAIIYYDCEAMRRYSPLRHYCRYRELYRSF